MASVVRTGVVRAAQGACVGARTTRVAATAGQRRGMAGGVEFARSKVKKDFFVEQYNDLRENKFKTWKFNGKTWFPITLMCAILPIGFYKVTKAELETNAEEMGRTKKKGFEFM